MEAFKVLVKVRVRDQGRIWDRSMRYLDHLLITGDLDPALMLEISQEGMCLDEMCDLTQQWLMLER